MDSDIAEAVAPVEAAPRPRNSDVMALFAVTWAAANLFHVWGSSGRITDLASNWTTVSALQALAGIVAIAVLVRPRSRVPLLVLAAVGPLVAWFEAPVVGNHWLVVAFVDVALLAAYAAARGGERFEQFFFPIARWILVGFYAFAAFAKLNHAFFNPEVSCATYYLDELGRSLHLTIHSQSGAGWTHLVPFLIAGVEVSVPPLLLFRRTRSLGVAVGIAFHGFIAVDQTHLFADFSSVLNALFVLFLPATFASFVFARYRQLSAEGRERLRSLVILSAAVLLLMELYGRGDQVARLFFDGQGWAWVSYDVALFVLVAAFLCTRPTPLERPLTFGDGRVPRWLAIIPALVILNGLSPYLELRTAYAWNMYSNLQTVDGWSNHFLVTRTLPVVDFQSDLVRIVDTSDPGLRLYIGEGFDLPYLQLRDYLSRHQDVSLSYVRGGATHHVDRASDDPDLVRRVPSWESKLFAYRALDQADPPRCQPAFLPAL